MKESTIETVRWLRVKRTYGDSQWDEHLLSVKASIDFDLWFTECENWIMPKGEYDYVDQSNDMHAWLDGYEMHWLVKAKGGIRHEVIDIKENIQEIANEKYWDYLNELDQENTKL